jgi:DNA-directed RNA polymerase subunit K/omega
MTDIKNKVQSINPSVKARDIKGLIGDHENLYKTLVIISKRANQIAVDLKSELHSKLEEFAIQSDTIEEIQENKEQIEISKFYERLPNPAIIATEEYLKDEIEFRNRFEDKSDDEAEEV